MAVTMRVALLLVAAGVVWGQQPDFRASVVGGANRVPVAVPDFRGPAPAQPFMAAFNQTLWDDLDDCGLVQLKPKTQYPKAVPQQPQELRAADWAMPPVSANYIAMGYTAVVDGQLALYGWLVDLRQSTAASGTVLAAHYGAPLNEAGARKEAHEFAADIIRKLGGTPLLDTKIYFTSDRGGMQNVWVMDADGSNQQQVTRLASKGGCCAAMTPAVSPDGSLLALTSYAEVFPKIFLFALGPSPRRLGFRLPGDELQTTPSFTPDGKRLIFAWHHQIYAADLDGNHPNRITTAAAEIEPKINPKNPDEVAFVSDRGGHARVYKMNIEGGDVMSLSSPKGEGTNPAWSPNGRSLAYACTQGYATGGFHICLMDVATQTITEIPNNGARDENPGWAPDGVHLVYMSTRGRAKEQIWIMQADGTHRRQLTTAGANKTPVWSVGR